MKKKYIQILIFLCFAAILSTTQANAQKAQKEKSITIESVVTDEKGTPIQGATIFGNEGASVAKTDASGKFAITVPEQTNLLVEADGFESAVFK